MTGGPLTVLQAGRALAAFAVVLAHAMIGTRDFVGELPSVLEVVLMRGFLGVDFFFVLSGFIIYYTSLQRPKTRKSAAHFAQRRLMRIFAPYLPITFVLIGVYLLLPELSASSREWAWLPSIFLLPLNGPPALNLAWTLQHELIFYMLFAAMFFSGKLVVGSVIWAAAIALASVIDHGLGPPLSFFLAPINLEFLFGMLAVHVAMRSEGSTMLFVGLSIVSLAAFLGLGAERNVSVLFGLAIAFALVPLVRANAAGKITVARWLMYFGGASYSLYLIHLPVISVTLRIAAKIPLLDTWFAALPFSILCALIAGAIYYIVIERPALSWMRGWSTSRLKHDEEPIA